MQIIICFGISFGASATKVCVRRKVNEMVHKRKRRNEKYESNDEIFSIDFFHKLSS